MPMLTYLAMHDMPKTDSFAIFSWIMASIVVIVFIVAMVYIIIDNKKR